MIFLSFLESGASRVYYLRKGDTIIGRSPSSGIVINHPTVSRQHARVRLSTGRCFVSDAGSRYGTLVNGVPVDGERELIPGDVVTIGAVAITVEQRIPEGDLLSERHQLVEEAETLVRRVRVTGDRRKVNLGSPAGERRSGRDRRGGRLLRLLGEIATALVATQPLNQILGRAADLVFDVVPAERVFLLLRDSAEEALTARVLRQRDGGAPDKSTLSRAVVDRVMRERVAILGSDARLHAPASAGAEAHDVRAFMCAPLWSRDDVIGVLYCDNPRANPFTAEDLDVFTALCNHVAVAIEQARASAQHLEELKRRERLQRHHAPAVVNRLLQAGTNADTAVTAQERDVTVMFCALVGFTRFAERRMAVEVAAVLNAYLTRMTEVIFEHEGTLDQFRGDTILAVFGAPLEQPDHAVRAAAAARELRRALAAMNAEPGAAGLRIRIALHSGRALAGDIGSARRREFTVLGDVVSTAALVEELAGPDQILMTSETWERVKSAVQTKPIGSRQLRGRDTTVDLYVLED